MSNAKMFQPEAGSWLTDAPPAQEERQWLRWAIAGGILSVVLLLFTAYEIGHAPVAGLQAQANQEGSQVTSLQHELAAVIQSSKRCWPYTRDVQTIRRLVDGGRFAAAAALANLDLSNTEQPACAQTYSALRQLWYAASIDGLLAASPTSPLDQTPVLTWISIERRADSLGLPTGERASPLSIFIQAYNRQEWALARACFLRAWGSSVGPADIAEVVAYYSTLRNFGRALIAEGGSSTHAGQVMLSTARAISDVYGLSRSEARNDLLHLVGPNSARWPRPDQHDPVLLAGETKR